MKRVIMIVLILLVLLAAYVVPNQFDAKAARFEVREQWDKPARAVHLSELYKPASFDKSNGFYRLWTLTEPPGVDIESDDVINKYRKLHDPQYDNQKYAKEWLENKEGRSSYGQYRVERDKILAKDSKWMNFPEKVLDDWCRELLRERKSVLELKSAYGVLLERYQKMLDSEQFEDFTLLVKDGDFIVDSPIPNLLAWLDVGKLYVAVNMLDAIEGNWNQGTAKLLAHIEFTKKSVKTSRTLVVNLIGKALTLISLHGLISIMNQKDCPKEIFQQVLDGLPPIAQEEFGNSKQLLAEGFLISSQIKKKGGLFCQVNRTQQYYYDFMAKLYLADKTPPYLWKEYPVGNDKVKTGWFWWLQNPGGKMAFQKFIDFQKFTDKKKGVNFLAASFRGYAVKTFYDLATISAELHLKYTPGKPVQEILNGLETYRTLPDICTGKPYIWRDDRQILYGIGYDKTDNGGGDSTRYTQIEGVDFAFPVVLF
ncbi:MAG TPA: hypothetical protein VK186_26370 [Candidatus Deferrimicrobium sp.]|nr:hypothetical protein [Candidatus Deferrimicrobium sp.]